MTDLVKRNQSPRPRAEAVLATDATASQAHVLTVETVVTAQTTKTAALV
jgi:hypothetical protein